MNNEDIREILEMVREHNLLSFEIEKDGERLKIQRSPLQGSYPVISEPGEADYALGGRLQNAPAPLSVRPEQVKVITSPIVGTFYRSSSPDNPPYVEVGTVVGKGQILCIIEAMKLMNEIESETSGTIRSFLVENGQPVEYGTPLIEIDTKAEESP
jgi:acetyl-CoA carboxylase biotin carboxyl carrier protein